MVTSKIFLIFLGILFLPIIYAATFLDNFNRANNDNLGTNWTEVIGNPLINSNLLKGTAVDFNLVTLNDSNFIGIHNSTQIVTCLTMPAGDGCGLAARYENVSNYYFVKLWGGGTNISLYKKVANVTTVLGYSNTSLDSGGISLIVNGTNLSVYLNNNLNISVIDTTFQNTTSLIGILVDDPTVFGFGADDYNVSTDTPATTTTSTTSSTTLPRFTANITIPVHNINLSTKNILIRANISTGTNIASINFSVWSSNGTYKFLESNFTQSNALIWFNSSMFNVTESGLWSVFIRLFDSAGQTTTTQFNFTVINTNPQFYDLIENPLVAIAPNYETNDGKGANISIVNINFTSLQTATGTNITGIAALSLSARGGPQNLSYNFTANLTGLSDQKYTLKIEASNGSGAQPAGICSSYYTQVVINNTQISGTIDSTTPAEGAIFDDEVSDGHGTYNITSVSRETIKEAWIKFGSNRYQMNISGTNGTIASFVPTSIQVPDSSYDWVIDLYDIDGAYKTTTAKRTVIYRYARDGLPSELLQQQLGQQVSVTTTKKSNLTIAVVALLLILALAGAFGKLGK